VCVYASVCCTFMQRKHSEIDILVKAPTKCVVIRLRQQTSWYAIFFFCVACYIHLLYKYIWACVCVYVTLLAIRMHIVAIVLEDLFVILRFVAVFVRNEKPYTKIREKFIQFAYTERQHKLKSFTIHSFAHITIDRPVCFPFPNSLMQRAKPVSIQSFCSCWLKKKLYIEKYIFILWTFTLFHKLTTCENATWSDYNPPTLLLCLFCSYPFN
jgi:hypothetical protein